MGINRTRGLLYTIARLLGDVNAVKKSRVGPKIGRSYAGRKAGGLFRRLFK